MIPLEDARRERAVRILTATGQERRGGKKSERGLPRNPVFIHMFISPSNILADALSDCFFYISCFGKLPFQFGRRQHAKHFDLYEVPIPKKHENNNMTK